MILKCFHKHKKSIFRNFENFLFSKNHDFETLTKPLAADPDHERPANPLYTVSASEESVTMSYHDD